MTILQKHLVFVPLSLAAFAAFCGLIVMLLWNWLMPTLFALPELTYCQAVGLFVLCKVLIGGFGSISHGCHGHHHGCHGVHNRLRERWENMTPEEREKLIAAHKECSCADSND